jgi:hypothetical protein
MYFANEKSEFLHINLSELEWKILDGLECVLDVS